MTTIQKVEHCIPSAVIPDRRLGYGALPSHSHWTWNPDDPASMLMEYWVIGAEKTVARWIISRQAMKEALAYPVPGGVALDFTGTPDEDVRLVVDQRSDDLLVRICGPNEDGTLLVGYVVHPAPPLRHFYRCTLDAVPADEEATVYSQRLDVELIELMEQEAKRRGQ